jgi:hypothetical protein
VLTRSVVPTISYADQLSVSTGSTWATAPRTAPYARETPMMPVDVWLRRDVSVVSEAATWPESATGRPTVLARSGQHAMAWPGRPSQGSGRAWLGQYAMARPGAGQRAWPGHGSTRWLGLARAVGGPGPVSGRAWPRQARSSQGSGPGQVRAACDGSARWMNAPWGRADRQGLGPVSVRSRRFRASLISPSGAGACRPAPGSGTGHARARAYGTFGARGVRSPISERPKNVPFFLPTPHTLQLSYY